MNIRAPTPREYFSEVVPLEHVFHSEKVYIKSKMDVVPLQGYILMTSNGGHYLDSEKSVLILNTGCLLVDLITPENSD